MVQPRKGRVERVTLSRADLAKTFARLGWVKEMWYEVRADSSEVCGLLYCRSLCLLGGVGGCLAHLPRPRPPVPVPYAILKPRLLVYYIHALMYACAHGELCSDGECHRVCVVRFELRMWSRRVVLELIGKKKEKLCRGALCPFI
jgi:hypothetical protein